MIKISILGEETCDHKDSRTHFFVNIFMHFKATAHKCLACRKSPNFKARVVNFYFFLCFVNITKKKAKSENNIFCFYFATFEHYITWAKTAKFEFLRARF
jgi:hypothetical protein